MVSFLEQVVFKTRKRLQKKQNIHAVLVSFLVAMKGHLRTTQERHGLFEMHHGEEVMEAPGCPVVTLRQLVMLFPESGGG